MSEERPQKVRVKETFGIKVMQVAAALLLLGALILGTIVVGGFLSRVVNGTTDQMKFSLNKTPEVTESKAPTATPSPTPTPYVIEEKLTMGKEEDLKTEKFFGPLPQVEEPVPYEHRKVRGLYIGAALNLDANIKIANESDIDTFVLDLKETDGVYYDSKNELAAEIGAVHPKYDLKEVVRKCRENGIYLIGRIVVFKDPYLSNAHPELSIRDSAGTPLMYSNEGAYTFLDPYNTKNWDYAIDLALEAVELGVDEIQFDYVRFPTGSSTSGTAAYYGLENEVPSKASAINRFLMTARRRIQDTKGVPVTADIFGIAVSSELDGKILGQDWKTLGFTGIDSLCPMIYPSHYALGTMMNGHVHEYPDKAPYQVMFDALVTGAKYHKAKDYCTVRPYCQAFTAAYIGSGNYMNYDYDAINDQIKAIQDSGIDEFILWNAEGSYPSGRYGGNNG